MTRDVGDILNVWHKDGSRVDLAPGARDTLENAMKSYLGAPGREFLPTVDQDCLIELFTVAGEKYTVLASNIVSWKYTTRDFTRGVAPLRSAVRDRGRRGQEALRVGACGATGPRSRGSNMRSLSSAVPAVRERVEFAVDVELRRYLDYLVPKINAARVAYGLASVPTFDEYSLIVRNGGRLP